MGAAAIPIMLSVMSMAMEMKSAQVAGEAADFERKQLEQQAAAIKTQALNEEANRRRDFYSAMQADYAQNAANNTRNFLQGSPQALAAGQEKELARDIAILKSNAASGRATVFAQMGAVTSRARGQQFAAFGRAAKFGLNAYSGLSTQTTTK